MRAHRRGRTHRGFSGREVGVVSRRPTYIIVSPVKDEGTLIERTIMSVRRQTLPPALWLIVDDGSRDQTPNILERHSREVEWIRVLRLGSGHERQPGSGVIRAFTAGYGTVRSLDFDFIVKLDCDLEFDHDYFERLLARFESDPTLGIASGMYYEERKGIWSPVVMPPYHAAGASKVVRRACFEQIQAFVPSRGWDTLDEIRAQVSGWKTCHFRDLKLHHLKPEGSGIGVLRTSVMSGEIYYLTGGGVLFFGLKCLQRVVAGKPPLVGALAMFFGYVRPRLRGRSRLVTKEEARHYRALLNGRISSAVGNLASLLAARCRKVVQADVRH